MEFTHIVDRYMGTNVYIFTHNGEALVVDPATNYTLVKDKLNELGARCTKVVLTHCHYDHAGCASKLEADGATVYVSEADAEQNSAQGSLATAMHTAYEPYRAPVLLHDGDEIPFADSAFTVIATPGHTKGSICLRMGDILLSGDTLFRHSYGRIDLPTGAAMDMLASIRKLLRLEGNPTVYPGHEAFSTLDEEREQNPLARW